MKTNVKQPSFLPPPGLTAAEYRAWKEKETEAGLAEANAGQVISHEVVRENILKRRLARVRQKKAA